MDKEKVVSIAQAKKLGTFLGVFTPSVLTILGVVLFLRAGWVVGQVGLLPALAIVCLAHCITFATALSVSAIATNMKVGAGGAYFMISRSLGLEIGGAIGVPLFLAQAFSVTLYSFGLVESLRLFWPDAPMRLVAGVTVVLVSLLAGKSAEFALKLQIPIMVAIVLAVGSLAVGAGRTIGDSVPLWAGDGSTFGFWAVFAVFFPAVTGLMAGVSMSGDLENPTKSIPLGTMLAVGVGFLFYLIVPILLAMSSEPSALMNDNLIWFQIAVVPVLIYPGLFGAIFSSAIGSILGAPRTLEALIEDGILPSLPKRGWLGKIGKHLPHAIATAVALGAVALGDLNAVAPVLSMFFLTTYGIVNLVAGLEQLSGSPSYRPAVRVPWGVSLAGAVGCLWVMALINMPAAIAAIIIELLIYFRLRRRAMAASWGDLRYGAIMSMTRFSLLKLRQLPVDPRNWRPNILLLAGDVERRSDLVRFGAWLNQERGVLTVAQLLIGDFDEQLEGLKERRERLDEFLEEEGIVAFGEVDIAADYEVGALALLQANGFAGLTSNTLMVGWSDKPERRSAHLRLISRAAKLEKSMVMCRIEKRGWGIGRPRLDVWWGGLQANGDMLLLFAYLISSNRVWGHADIHIKAIATSEMSRDKIERGLAILLERSRIKAQTSVLSRPEGETVQDVIRRESRDADLVFMGLQAVEAGDEDVYGERLESLLVDLPTTILIHAAGPFAGHLLASTSDAE